ncbi:hypothetical protein Pint_20308 [Pistacia integerrima]|uniref:Uncharacterized protein n=1 Tax=Pistacia integerrima TaxID=434235 RepID=A0ACC0XA98_9ROSI|nr:hypothetical protein Pint_20308 [Pistacia integerrima]
MGQANFCHGSIRVQILQPQIFISSLNRNTVSSVYSNSVYSYLWVENPKNIISDASAALGIDKDGICEKPLKCRERSEFFTPIKGFMDVNDVKMITINKQYFILYHGGTFSDPCASLNCSDSDFGSFPPRYIGIWFNKIPIFPVWVANPENLVPDSSGVLTIDSDGTLTTAYNYKVPSLEAFRLGLDPDGSDQLTVWSRGEVYCRTGLWKNESFQLVTGLSPRILGGVYEFRNG